MITVKLSKRDYRTLLGADADRWTSVNPRCVRAMRARQWFAWLAAMVA